MKYTFFWAGEFSQWHPSNFIVDDVQYNCAEQYMMAQKALLFGDTFIYYRIMGTSVPKEQKMLGRYVIGFDAAKWEENCKSIVYKANVAKFSQDPFLKECLEKTIGTMMVEASPYDKVWGIGLGPDDPLRVDPNNWQGTNYLGEVLTAVRKKIFSHTDDLSLLLERFDSFCGKTISVHGGTYLTPNTDDVIVKTINSIAKLEGYSIRWWFPKTMGTSEYRFNRINISLDKDNKIMATGLG